MWQPIETAPRDATAILVMRDIWAGTRSGRAEECNGHNTYVAAWWPEERGGQGAWICYTDTALDPECPVEPTHWMPLPDPPGAQPVPSVPREAIEKMLTQLMDIAVSNGANSVSMPDEYVEVAAWLCGIPAQPTSSVPELLESLRCACNYIDKLGGCSRQYRAALAATETKPTSSVPDGWLRAIDEALVTAHIGVANAHDTYEQAKPKLDNLIGFHVGAATDPAVNGGYKLMPAEPTREIYECFAAYDGSSYSNPFDFDDFREDYLAAINSTGLPVGAKLYALPGAQVQPAPSVPEWPYPCGWRNLLKHAMEDGAYLARSINEDEPVTEKERAVTMRMVLRLRDVLMAINNAAPETKT